MFRNRKREIKKELEYFNEIIEMNEFVFKIIKNKNEKKHCKTFYNLQKYYRNECLRLEQELKEL